MTRSLLQAVKAPFYGAVCYLANLYGLLNPLSGRVVLASLERDWNNDVIRSRGVWGIFCEKNYMFEGGGTRSGLGQNAWYLLGCFQPVQLFLLFQEGWPAFSFKLLKFLAGKAILLADLQ